MSRHGRKWVSEVWDATASTAGELEALSPITTVVGNRLVENYAVTQNLQGGDIQRALRTAVVAGYAARSVLLKPTEQPKLRPGAFGLGTRANAETSAGDSGALDNLLDRQHPHPRRRQLECQRDAG